MAFDFGILVAVVVSLLCIAVAVLFFRVYGAFKHPIVALILMLVSAAIPLVMVIGILPYDISLCLFGQNNDTDHSALRWGLEVLYWVSFALTWVVVPIVVSFLRYKESISLRHRIWLTIRENLIVYGAIVCVIGIGLVILFATNQMTVSNLFPLVISLANGYGLLVLCLCLGHGFIAMPRTVWLMASPGKRYLYHLHRLAQETRMCAATIADGDAAAVYCVSAEDKLTGELKEMYDKLGKPRAVRLNQLKGEVPVPDQFYTGTSKNKKIEKLRKVEWETCKTGQLEDFFALMDETITRMEEATNILQDSGKTALRALEQYEMSSSRVLTWLQRLGAILLFLLNLVCLWGEVTLIFKKEYSLFYMLSHVNMPKLVGILCVSTPILAYLVFVGSWSLTHLRLGSFFKFTKGATNANTLNYFAIILCRLGPTVGFHYLQQIGAYNSEFQKVMGVMDVVVFIGNQWNIYAPVLLVVMVIFFAFRVPDRILSCCGKESFSFDYSLMNYEDLATGEEVLKELQPDAVKIIEGGLRYSVIVNEEHHVAARKNGKNLKEHLNDGELEEI